MNFSKIPKWQQIITKNTDVVTFKKTLIPVISHMSVFCKNEIIRVLLSKLPVLPIKKNSIIFFKMTFGTRYFSFRI